MLDRPAQRIQIPRSVKIESGPDVRKSEIHIELVHRKSWHQQTPDQECFNVW
jgi:hypothetical protein